MMLEYLKLFISYRNIQQLKTSSDVPNPMSIVDE